ncbi:hypothetical protein [Pseudophaeobacter sp.]|jgi:hypothetical protein|uniref:Uncharacterized protein n=1 Tax=Pseudophaeobacter arcticus TaxID=385492 RepID=A0ABQ0AG57_9RHOB|nr:hypothetical protein N1037_01025 [Phaeobacter sp. G2]
MTASNRDIAISYLDMEAAEDVAWVKQRVQKALKTKSSAELPFNTFSLEVDPKKQTVTLHQDWFGCQPEIFSADEFFDLVSTSRSRRKNA